MLSCFPAAPYDTLECKGPHPVRNFIRTPPLTNPFGPNPVVVLSFIPSGFFFYPTLASPSRRQTKRRRTERIPFRSGDLFLIRQLLPPSTRLGLAILFESRPHAWGGGIPVFCHYVEIVETGGDLLEIGDKQQARSRLGELQVEPR